MRVDVFGLDSDLEPRQRGSIRLDPSSKRVEFDPEVARMEDVVVLEPGNPRRRLTPRDGALYLRAVPYEFHGVYFCAVLTDE